MSDIIERLKFLAADDVEALMKAELATIAQAIAKLSFHCAMLTSIEVDRGSGGPGVSHELDGMLAAQSGLKDE